MEVSIFNLFSIWVSLRIHQEAQTLSLQPLMGRPRPELAEGVRSWPTSTRYILFYVPADDGVTVLRVLHHARDIPNVSMN